MKIYEALKAAYFAGNIRVLIETFDSKLADAGNTEYPQLIKHFCEQNVVSSQPQS
jgi:hypothetical protein